MKTIRKSEATLEILEEKVRRGDWSVTECIDTTKPPSHENRYVSVTTTSAAEGELEPGETYRFWGKWENGRYGLQFVADTFVKALPLDERGIALYLQRCEGIGKAKAAKILGAFGQKSLSMVRDDPTKVAEMTGLAADTLERASLLLKEQGDREAVQVELMGLLAGRGFRKELPQVLLQECGNRAPELVRSDPWMLLSFPGCGFIKVDKLYLELGGDPDDPMRQAYALWHAFDTGMDGDTWYSASEAAVALTERIGSGADLALAARTGLEKGMLERFELNAKETYITSAGRAWDEQSAVNEVRRLEKTTSHSWPSVSTLEDLSDHQATELGAALRGRIGVFLGRPGTGKSYTVARLVRLLLQRGSALNVAVMAPTGKAAVRVNELFDELGLDAVKARTIHSSLGVRGYSNGHFTFEHDDSNPLESDFVIVDEASMIDTRIMAALLRAIPESGHVLFVGDLNQLAPVGHGKPLADLVASKCVPVGSLREIRRNSGAIVEACAAIQDGSELVLPDRIDREAGANLMLFDTDTSSVSHNIITLLQHLAESRGIDPVWDCQVIVALNERGDLSRKSVNQALQRVFNDINRDDPARGALWPDDKVVCLSNRFMPADDSMTRRKNDVELAGLMREKSRKIDCYIANGEIGRVLTVEPKRVRMEFFSPSRIVVCPRKPGAKLEGFDLGYAVSCHKFQGSQCPIVIVGLDDSGGARVVCDRSWIYTAISRASDECYLIGRKKTVENMRRENRIVNRRTFIATRLWQ